HLQTGSGLPADEERRRAEPQHLRDVRVPRVVERPRTNAEPEKHRNPFASVEVRLVDGRAVRRRENEPIARRVRRLMLLQNLGKVRVQDRVPVALARLRPAVLAQDATAADFDSTVRKVDVLPAERDRFGWTRTRPELMENERVVVETLLQKALQNQLTFGRGV